MPRRPSVEKEYIGDGAYVQYDGYSLWLTTENGERETNKVCLEPSVFKNLLEYAIRVENINREGAINQANERAEELTENIPK